MDTKQLLIITALCGALSVLLGAFGAHTLKPLLSASQLSTWQTAVHYHQLHSVLAVGLCLRLLVAPNRRLTLAVYATLLGILLFSGSLYGLALDGPKLLGPITPLGGLFLILGWLLLMAYAIRLPAPER